MAENKKGHLSNSHTDSIGDSRRPFADNPQLEQLRKGGTLPTRKEEDDISQKIREAERALANSDTFDSVGAARVRESGDGIDFGFSDDLFGKKFFSEAEKTGIPSEELKKVVEELEEIYFVEVDRGKRIIVVHDGESAMDSAKGDAALFVLEYIDSATDNETIKNFIAEHLPTGKKEQRNHVPEKDFKKKFESLLDGKPHYAVPEKIGGLYIKLTEQSYFPGTGLVRIVCGNNWQIIGKVDVPPSDLDGLLDSSQREKTITNLVRRASRQAGPQEEEQQDGDSGAKIDEGLPISVVEARQDILPDVVRSDIGEKQTERANTKVASGELTRENIVQGGNVAVETGKEDGVVGETFVSEGVRSQENNEIHKQAQDLWRRRLEYYNTRYDIQMPREKRDELFEILLGNERVKEVLLGAEKKKELSGRMKGELVANLDRSFSEILDEDDGKMSQRGQVVYDRSKEILDEKVRLVLEKIDKAKERTDLGDNPAVDEVDVEDKIGNIVIRKKVLAVIIQHRLAVRDAWFKRRDELTEAKTSGKKGDKQRTGLFGRKQRNEPLEKRIKRPQEIISKIRGENEKIFGSVLMSATEALREYRAKLKENGYKGQELDDAVRHAKSTIIERMLGEFSPRFSALNQNEKDTVVQYLAQ